MNKPDPEVVVAQVLSKVLKRAVAPAENVSREADDAWDSLTHMEIVFTVEAALGVRLSDEEIGSIMNATDLVTAARRHLAE